MMQDPTNLRIPGPTPIPPQVIEAMSQPVIPHRGSAFGELFAELRAQLRRIHNTRHDVFVVAGSGSTGWEASIVNTLAPGDTVLAAVNGNFGERFVTVAERFGVNVVRVDAEWGSPIDPEAVRETLNAHPEIKAVQIVHNETSTGVLNPLSEIGPIVRDHGALFIVDSVSGIGGAPILMDDWCCDLVFSGSQKAFMCPPGLSIMAVGERVWEVAEQAPMPRFMLDFQRMREAAEAGSTPSTGPVNLIYGLKAACEMMEAEGLEQVYERHRRLAAHTRSGLQEVGLSLLVDEAYASPTVTTAWMPEGVSSRDVQKAMRDEHGIEIATGQGHLREQLIRIGHMGWTHQPELDRTIKALDSVLERIPATGSAAV